MPRRSILPTHTRCLFAALALLLPNGSPAWAIWAPVPLEILIDESVLIVVGKVTKIERAGFAVGDRTMDVAIVEVAETLKKLPHVNNPKQIRILQPAAGGSAISTDLRYAVGQAGIWLLAMQQDGKAYVIRHPSQFQPLEEKPKLVEQIATHKHSRAGNPSMACKPGPSLSSINWREGPSRLKLA